MFLNILIFITEFIGTFLFLSIILLNGNAFVIGISLAVLIWFGSLTSGGHYNPAVSLINFMDNKIENYKLIIYVVAQILGGLFALSFYKNIKKYAPNKIKLK